MKYFNADGQEGSMCGNGGRCITAFAKRLDIISAAPVFESIDGIHSATILANNEIRLKLNDVSGIKTFNDGYLLNTGSPHFIQFVKNSGEIDVNDTGKNIRHEARFSPGGVNVNFVEIIAGSNRIRVRTYERGVEEETLSCGTGVTAAAICTCYHKKSDIFSYNIESPGGLLNVSFKTGPHLNFTDVYLTGPVAHVFDGIIEM